MVVIAVKRQTIRTDKIRNGSVVISVFGKDLVVPNGFAQALDRGDLPFDRIADIELIAPAVCGVQCDWSHGSLLLSQKCFSWCYSPF